MHLKLGQYEEAISDYRTSLGYIPDHPWELSIYQQIASCYYKQQSYHEVISYVLHMRSIANKDGIEVLDFRLYEMLSGAYFGLQQLDQAAHTYQLLLNNTFVTFILQTSCTSILKPRGALYERKSNNYRRRPRWI